MTPSQLPPESSSFKPQTCINFTACKTGIWVAWGLKKFQWTPGPGLKSCEGLTSERSLGRWFINMLRARGFGSLPSGRFWRATWSSSWHGSWLLQKEQSGSHYDFHGSHTQSLPQCVITWEGHEEGVWGPWREIGYHSCLSFATDFPVLTFEGLCPRKPNHPEQTGLLSTGLCTRC